MVGRGMSLRVAVLSTIAILALPLASCARRPVLYVAPSQRASAAETLEIALAPAGVQQMMQALQDDAAIGGSAASVRIEPAVAQRQTSSQQTDAYVGALDDARAKASAIARHLNVRLGSVTSVQELIAQNGYNAYRAAPLPRAAHMAVPNGVQVQMPSNALVMLSVSFATSGAPISVFGYRAPRSQTFGSTQVQGVLVTIGGRGATLAAAVRAESAVDAEVRAVARRLGVPSTAITVHDTFANTY